MLPIGILFSNMGSGQLMTCPRTLSGPFWHMSLFGDSRAVQVLMPKYRPFRKSFFFSMKEWRLSWGLGVLGGQMAGLYGGTIFRGGARHLGALAGLQIWRFGFLVVFRHICGSLEGTRHWSISSSISLEVQSRVA